MLLRLDVIAQAPAVVCDDTTAGVSVFALEPMAVDNVQVFGAAMLIACQSPTSARAEPPRMTSSTTRTVTVQTSSTQGGERREGRPAAPC